MVQGDPVDTPLEPPLVATRMSHFRWVICGLLFYATTVNYMDRVVMGILKTTISQDLHWTETDYGTVTAAFQIGYALMLPVAGRIIDWIGLRIGYPIAVLVWGLASLSHGFAGNLFQFSLARFGLGIGEAANFPSAIKTVADWFPRKERALATGWFNSGSNIGALIAPILVPLIVVRYGWHAGFFLTGAISLSWIFFWLVFYREPEKNRRVSRKELEWIRSDGPEEADSAKISYLDVLKRRATWALLLGKFFTDPVWWFYLFWVPGFLATNYHVDLQHIGPPLVVIYLAADVGSVGGGWLSSYLLKRGWEVTRARKTALLFFACSVTAVMFVPFAGGNLWLTVALIGIAAAAHQGWSANLYTMSTDCFPRKAIATVVGLGGLGGAIGGALAQPAVGMWLDWSGKNYAVLFIVAGSMYLISLLVVHLLLPRFAPERF